MVFKKIGLGFIILGLIETGISGISCKSLCRSCTAVQIKPCFFLFIFVGIILMVAGISIMSLNKQKLPEVKLVKKNK